MRARLLMMMLLALTGCGFIAHGTSQKIYCMTNPDGALVRSVGGTSCKTPCTVTLKRKNDDVLTIEREGYETISLSLHSVLSKYSAGCILLPGGLVYWGIDMVCGAGYRLVPERVEVDLKPVIPAGLDGRPERRRIESLLSRTSTSDGPVMDRSAGGRD